MILTFDPRHGMTCHQDHRVAATLALQAVERAGSPSRNDVYLLEARLEPKDPNGATAIGLSKIVDDPAILVYDATTVLPWTNRQAWDAVVELVKLHKSQGVSKLADVFGQALPATRIVPVLRWSDAVENDVRYQALCP
jgi:LmbE family N-acetylglucosaminyl deacetylase